MNHGNNMFSIFYPVYFHKRQIMKTFKLSSIILDDFSDLLKGVICKAKSEIKTNLRSSLEIIL